MLWDAADLLARCKRQAMEPDISQITTDDDWFAFLTEAEAHWKPIIAAHYAQAMYEPPTRLLPMASTSPDRDQVWVFVDPADGITPIVPLGQVEVYTSPRGRLMLPGAYWDAGADYVMEGGAIRITAGRTMSFPDGAPWARYVTPPGEIHGGDNTVIPAIPPIESTIRPEPLRLLDVYRALYNWASRGGFQDPSFYRALEQKAWMGDPDIPGDVGLMGSLKLQNTAHGMAGFLQSPSRRWYMPEG